MKSSFFLFGLILSLLISCTEKKAETEVASTPKHEVQLEEGNYNVAFLIMDGTFNTELTAPYDIFHHTKFRDVEKKMNVFTVANTLKPITTFEGIRILPDFDYIKDKLPHIDILIVPSAEHHMDSDLEDDVMLEFVKKVAKDAKFVVSHCDGAFVLAKAGLLDNVFSTTFPADVDAMRKMFPSLVIRKDVMFVHEDNIITSAGGAKSFEASLYLCELLYGKAVADEIAEGMVIDWDLESVPKIIVRPLLD